MKVPDMVERALNESGLPWRVVHGRGHLKLYLDDHFIGVVSSRAKDVAKRRTLNLLAQIKRVARGEKPLGQRHAQQQEMGKP